MFKTFLLYALSVSVGVFLLYFLASETLYFGIFAGVVMP